MSGASVDAVLVAYNQRELVVRAAESLARLTPRPRIVIVDNGSDGSGAAVRERIPDAELIVSDGNSGFGAAVNLGVGRRDAPYLLLVNSDARIEQPAFDALRRALHEDAAAAGAGPRIRDEHGALELTVGRTMSPWSEARFKLLGALHRDGRGPLTSRLERRYERPCRTTSLSAACLLMRREAFERVGGFDERFFLYAEDVDLCLRVVDAGLHWLYVPGAEVVHARGASGAAEWERTERRYRASQVAFYAKHNGRLATAALRAYLRVKYGVRWLFGDREQAARVLRALGAPSRQEPS